MTQWQQQVSANHAVLVCGSPRQCDNEHKSSASLTTHSGDSAPRAASGESSDFIRHKNADFMMFVGSRIDDKNDIWAGTPLNNVIFC